MTLEEFLKQERGIRKGVHFHDGIWWKKTFFGSCRPLYPLQEIVPGSARPSMTKSFLRYSYFIPKEHAGPHKKTRTWLLIQGERLKNYSLDILDRKRRQAINKAVRCEFKTAMIHDLSKHRRDLHEIFILNAARNRHGLPERWYVEHEEQWWNDLSKENALPGRDWFGVFQGEKLVAFFYGCLVEDTALLFVTKSNKEYLDSNPNDLLLFDVITHYQHSAGCCRIDGGAPIPVPPTIDSRKKSFGFEPVEMPIFEKTNRFVLGMVRAPLFLASPFLNSSTDETHRGLLFKIKTIKKRLDDSGEFT